MYWCAPSLINSLKLPIVVTGLNKAWRMFLNGHWNIIFKIVAGLVETGNSIF